ANAPDNLTNLALTYGGAQSTGLGSATAVTVGGTFHLECNYDSATGNLHEFVNGVEAASSPVSTNGLVIQAPWEQVSCGGSKSNLVEDNSLGAAPIGLVDNIRISNVARHTSNFTPPAAK